MISAGDCDLLTLTDDVDEALKVIRTFSDSSL
jgi:hypothetical protein